MNACIPPAAARRGCRTKISKDGRIVFDVAPEYSERDKVWKVRARLLPLLPHGRLGEESCEARR